MAIDNRHGTPFPRFVARFRSTAFGHDQWRQIRSRRRTLLYQNSQILTRRATALCRKLRLKS